MQSNCAIGKTVSVPCNLLNIMNFISASCEIYDKWWPYNAEIQSWWASRQSSINASYQQELQASNQRVAVVFDESVSHVPLLVFNIR